MMGLLRAVAKSNRSIQTSIQNQGLTLPLCRQFSTQMETPQKDNSSDPFPRNPSSGLVYGRLFVTGKHTRKSDILNMLGSSRLSPDDVRFEYNMNYAPVSV
uniref:Putative ovule protein n=1 Tax=Solanum chacoense TaxID=4108 RepID=A0A0V0HF05_SOLCH